MEVADILKRALELSASDIFVVAGLPLTYKVSGRQCREGDPLKPKTPGPSWRPSMPFAGAAPPAWPQPTPTTTSPLPFGRWGASGPMCCTSAVRWRWCCG